MIPVNKLSVEIEDLMAVVIVIALVAITVMLAAIWAILPTQRERIAMAAMQGLLAAPGDHPPAKTAKIAVLQAEALVDELKIHK